MELRFALEAGLRRYSDFHMPIKYASGKVECPLFFQDWEEHFGGVQ